MPYELTFRRPLQVSDPDLYLNECCIGGDVVCAAIRPALESAYDGLTSNQEDWGWFIWFSENGVDLAVDVFCEDPAAGDYKVHLTSRVRRFFLPAKVNDTPELEALRLRVTTALTDWLGTQPRCAKLDSKHLPVEDEA
jgi:hypothetical protein